MSRVLIDPETDVLGVVDVQPTFMPGGELAVADGEAVVPAINQLLTQRFRHAFATQDWHPAGHISFASTHARAPFAQIDLPYGPQTLWPDHALQGSATAALHGELVQAPIEIIVRKGFHLHTDSYSAFFENDRRTPTGLHGWLQQRGFRRLFLCGLATDFCVAWSAEDAAALGYEVYVIKDACRGIDVPGPDGRSTIELARERMEPRGVRLLTSDALG
jgi:nicotinamidase/pyrazinamidase